MPPALEAYAKQPDVVNKVVPEKKGHTTEPATTFEFVNGVTSMRRAIFDNEKGPFEGNHVMQLYVWALVTLKLNHMMRSATMGMPEHVCNAHNTLLTHPHVHMFTCTLFAVPKCAVYRAARDDR